MGHEFDREHAPAPERRARPERGPDPSLPPLAAAGNAAFTELLRTTGAVPRQEAPSQGAGPLDPAIGAAIDSARGGGAPLPEPVRADMEQHLGVDLGAVRVHSDSRADTLSRSVQAEAFTTGTDVFFSSGSYQPASAAGRELLAHELTHVVQQHTAAAGADARVSHPDDAAEVEARAVAGAVGPHATAPAGGAVDDHE